ncbi:3-hydroxyacyl-CoA dehydrogenase PaaH [Denitromonas iodatirespirans]|uniref:3-hydroxyacyl-CoA dehydrogenase PaaC n=1 Tax=Denitromonas iodatirespirans TaxID=2795389 RepID=A0A944H9U8_DENI1|nr:3-hydroxyacyl-CoA dehydrogenase PaaH [Denitromonas iodatirespirans]MBT0963833.1 3-hydroxyacyl-CoA dehydrogenase PaaC [Denitromonas iodatirespirans]
MKPLPTTETVAVIGAGAMGSGIAQVAARAGHTVRLFDMNPEAIERGIASITRNLDFLVERGKLDAAEREATAARLVPTTRLEALADAGLIIEAIVEKLEVKQTLFAELERIAPQAILASNTSSLSITAIGSVLRAPERLAGLHFFNPADRMRLVEIVSGLATAPALAGQLFATAKAWGKDPVHTRSTPGFIVNRVARPFYAEGLKVLAEGAASPASLDAVMRDGAGFPMGPFELTDLIGHDVNYAVTASVFEANYGDDRFIPSLIQHELVLAGRLGRKRGQGFYAYGEGAQRPAPDYAEQAPRPAAVTLRGAPEIWAPLVARLEAAGVRVERAACPDGVAAHLAVGPVRLALTDGRTATRRSVDEGCDDLVLFDLVKDFATSDTLAAAVSDRASAPAWQAAAGTLQAAGFKLIQLDDVPGLLAMRTVAMLANEGADAVMVGVASPGDVDLAMQRGTNYPKGPLAWADEIGLARVATVLGHLLAHYGESRYRASPLLQRRQLAGRPLSQAAPRA